MDQNSDSNPKRASKHDGSIRIDASPEDVVRSLFNGRPKKHWRYLKKNQRTAATSRRYAKR